MKVFEKILTILYRLLILSALSVLIYLAYLIYDHLDMVEYYLFCIKENTNSLDLF